MIDIASQPATRDGAALDARPVLTVPGAGTTLPFPPAGSTGTLRVMDDRNPAEEFPLVYREVLDAVASLEAAGDRDAAYDLRARGQRTYATRWDAGGLRALQKLVREANAKLGASQLEPGRQAVPSAALAKTA